MRFFSGFTLFALALAVLPAHSAEPLPAAGWTNLPAWRGFNLLNKFMLPWNNGPFSESDFQFIAAHGFNFVRLPMDYRTYIAGGDWELFSESALAEIDQAVSWGGQHGVHVCLNLHRIPGWTVATPAEPKSLWTDPDAQRVAARHWSMFASRYRGIPNDRLSFNLLNEPPEIAPATYSNVVALLAAAIRAEDPGRLIICDGLGYATRPVPELIPLEVAQATRGYTPFGLTHYRASWVAGSDTWPTPTWPGSLVNGYLYGPQKPEFRSALRIEGPFPTDTSLRIRVLQVSARSLLTAKAGTMTVTNKLFVPGPGTGEWKEVIFAPQWNIYQNLYDRDYTMTIPAGAPWVTLENTDGDWMTFAEIGLTPAGGAEAVISAGSRDWGVRQSITVSWRPQADPAVSYSAAQDAAWLWRQTLQPWLDLRARGVGVMVGEWGSHSATPHAVTLAWMRDMLNNFENVGLGWALWNLDGSFGPVNSGRPEVIYETYQGRRLDRAMFDLLREYTGRREAYWRWQERVLPAGLPEPLRQPTADAAGDGIVNFARYALALPVGPVPLGGLPRLVGPFDDAQGRQVELHYRHSLREVGTGFRVLTSDDLATWREVLEPGRIVEVTPDYETKAVRVPADSQFGFVRLELAAPPW
ncbi:MAG: cellulase family glycosylhydrolase [Verrucomicrobia bacterium]|nr:cellulase family glycosylhydrolase [Verrucomicrobiota bacterium]